jgi:hypothetical protein
MLQGLPIVSGLDSDILLGLQEVVHEQEGLQIALTVLTSVCQGNDMVELPSLPRADDSAAACAFTVVSSEDSPLHPGRDRGIVVYALPFGEASHV